MAYSAQDGDFDCDADFDLVDVDQLVSAIASSDPSLIFDLNGDGLANGDDLTIWLELGGAANLASGNPYLPGDANLDGTVDGIDFLAWNTNKFSSTAAWSARRC